MTALVYPMHIKLYDAGRLKVNAKKMIMCLIVDFHVHNWMYEVDFINNTLNWMLYINSTATKCINRIINVEDVIIESRVLNYTVD